jgi:hypothetical protein
MKRREFIERQVVGEPGTNANAARSHFAGKSALLRKKHA